MKPSRSWTAADLASAVDELRSSSLSSMHKPSETEAAELLPDRSWRREEGLWGVDESNDKEEEVRLLESVACMKPRTYPVGERG